MPIFDISSMEMRADVNDVNDDSLPDTFINEAGQAHVLVVDDEPEILKMLRLNLTKAGYQVTTAANGEEALNVLRQSKIDVLFTDVMMPTMGGFELLGRVCADSNLNDLPVIITSAKPCDPDRESWTESLREAYQAQRIWHLVKPHNMYEAVCAVDAALRQDGHPGWKQWIKNQSLDRERTSVAGL